MAQREVKATSVSERVSFKQSQTVAQTIRSKNLRKAKKILEEVLAEKKTITYRSRDGKQYPKTTHALLTLLKSAEANAKQKNMDTEKMFVKKVQADQGFKYIRPKSAAKYRGRKAKITTLSVTLEEK